MISEVYKSEYFMEVDMEQKEFRSKEFSEWYLESWAEGFTMVSIHSLLSTGRVVVKLEREIHG